jgi:5-hydroxyisourate hydrolase
MSRGVSIHAVDVAAGVPAAGMTVELLRLAPDSARVTRGVVAEDGHWRPEDRSVLEALPEGLYEAVFHVGAWLAERGTPSFLDTVPFRFRVAATDGHCHLPLKFTPWGYALFRGA